MIDLVGAYAPVLRPLITPMGELVEKVAGPLDSSVPLTVRYSSGFVTVRGSLPKFWKGSNLLPLNSEELDQALEFTAEALGPWFYQAKVGQLEVGTTLSVVHLPARYTLAWRSFGRYQWSCWKDGETVQIGNRNLTFQGYDKGRETGRCLPAEDFPQRQGLRLELRYRKASAVRRAFGRNLTVQDLRDLANIEQLKENWKEFYFRIPKCTKPLTSLQGLTPAQAKAAWAKVGLEHLGWNDTRWMITEAQKSGRLHKTSASRMRQAMRELLTAAELVDQDPLIEELDRAVRSA